MMFVFLLQYWRSIRSAGVAIALIPILSACVGNYALHGDGPKKVIGFSMMSQSSPVALQAANSTPTFYHQSALVDAGLETHRVFRIKLKDLAVVTKNGAADISDEEEKLAVGDSCLAEPLFGQQAPIRIELNEKQELAAVTIYLRSPFYMDLGRDAARGAHLSKWVQECHSDSLDAWWKGQTFKDRVVQRILNELKRMPVGNPGPTASKYLTFDDDTKAQLREAVGDPFLGLDALLYEDRQLAKSGMSNPYIGQKLEPGEELCFHASEHATGIIDSYAAETSEPAAPGCFPWMTITRAEYRLNFADNTDVVNASNFAAVGVDPLGRVGNEWLNAEADIPEKEIDCENLITPPLNDSTAHTGIGYYGVPNKSANVRDFLSSVDSINDPSNKPYRFAMVFAKNQRFMLAQGPEWDNQIDARNCSDGKKKCNQSNRGGFLLLSRDKELLSHLRAIVLNETPINGPQTPTSFNDRQEDLTAFLHCVAKSWLSKNRGTSDVRQWMQDIILPINSRPFVNVPVTVDGHREYVRAGTTLLNLIDRRLALSGQVFALRSGEKNINNDDAAGTREVALIRAALKGIRYLRRTGVSWQPVDLSDVSRIEDLMLPIKLGDDMSWQYY